MRALYLLRHSLTAANEARLYCGSTNLPLSPAGQALARELRESRPLPVCERYITSGMRRADETLFLLTGHAPDQTLADLREMNFGAFEMHSYDELCHDGAYIRWIEDETGRVACPDGESAEVFRARVLRGGEALLRMSQPRILVVCHGGAIVSLMQAWFPGELRNFYEWQPRACGGYRIDLDGETPIRFEALRAS